MLQSDHNQEVDGAALGKGLCFSLDPFWQGGRYKYISVIVVNDGGEACPSILYQTKLNKSTAALGKTYRLLSSSVYFAFFGSSLKSIAYGRSRFKLAKIITIFNKVPVVKKIVLS